MNTYENISKYLLHIIEDEGRTDMQCHILTIKAKKYELTAQDIAKDFFGGKIITYSGRYLTEKQDMVFCVYDCGDYMYDYAKDRLEFEDYFIVLDAADQRVYCFPIEN